MWTIHLQKRKLKYLIYLYGEMFSLILTMHSTALNNQISRIKEMNTFNDGKDVIRALSYAAWWEWPLAQPF